MAKGMNGIINSGIDPKEDFTHDELCRLLKEPDYLIALLQKHCYDYSAYDPDEKKFGNITPNQYVKVVSKALERLENDVWNAIRAYEKTLNKELSLDFGRWDSECDYTGGCKKVASNFGYDSSGEVIAHVCDYHMNILDNEHELNGIMRWKDV